MSDESIPVSARDHVETWLAENQDRLGLSRLKLDRTELPAKILSAWFETLRYRIDITAWDHACCLDILVLEQTTDNLVFSEAGSCEDVAGLSNRLCLFSAWLSSHESGA
jgi:hypothetical protein